MLFFTADEHYGHKNIIKYCNRPFKTTEEMDDEIIKRHNEVVNNDDVVVHGGDFTLKGSNQAKEYISKLKGKHIFLMGSHDKWLLDTDYKYIWRKRIDNQLIVVCHYAFRVWEQSHYNSWNLFGHSHSKLESQGKQHDIGVDNNDFYPISFYNLKGIMKNKPDNSNVIVEQKRS